MAASYEKIWDMPFTCEKPGERRAPHWLGNLLWVALGFLFKILFRYRVDGRESLRQFKGKGGVLVVSNHTSFLDVVFLYLSARPSQWLRFVGRDTLFDNAGGLVGHILTRVGAFPIKRDSADRTAIKRATRMLKQGEPVAIMPEGTRRGKGSQVPTIHSGAAFIAKMAHVPILPMTVRDAELVKQKGKFFRFPKITVEYGTPFLVSEFDFLPKEDRIDACTWYAMRECFALSKRIPAEDVDMVELFPTSKDYTEVLRGFKAAPYVVEGNSASSLNEATKTVNALETESSSKEA